MRNDSTAQGFRRGIFLALCLCLHADGVWGQQDSCDESCDQMTGTEEESSWLNDHLLGSRFTNATGIHTEGWIAQGFSWNPDSPADRFNGFLSNNDRANEYQLNQLYLSLGKDCDDESGGLSFGFQTDLIYGTDAFLMQSLGFDDNTVSDERSRFYKLAIPQLYGEVFVPVGDGINILLGKWYTLAGYETGLAPSDPFYSHTLGYNLTPYTHTGVLVQSSFGQQWSFAAGVHRGSDVVEDNNNNLGFTGSCQWFSQDELTNVYFGIVAGPEQDEKRDWQDLDGSPGPDTPGENINRVIYSLAVERSINDEFTVIINHDLFYQDGSETYGLEQAEAYGLTGYLLREVNENLSLGLRAEVFRDDDGFVTSGFRSFNDSAAGVYTNFTAGLNLTISECTIVRPELRWDWQERDDRTDTPAFDDGSDTNQFLFAFDVVSSF